LLGQDNPTGLSPSLILQ